MRQQPRVEDVLRVGRAVVIQTGCFGENGEMVCAANRELEGVGFGDVLYAHARVTVDVS